MHCIREKHSRRVFKCRIQNCEVLSVERWQVVVTIVKIVVALAISYPKARFQIESFFFTKLGPLLDFFYIEHVCH